MSPLAQGPETNPFAAPRVQEGGPTTDAELGSDEALRRAHINHEASVQGIGSMFLLAALLWGLTALFMTQRLLNEPWGILLVGSVAVCWGLTGLTSWVGRSLRRLHARAAHVAALVMAICALLAVPLGTLLGIYMLYILGSAKGRYVLSEPYRQVVLQTPHIRYRTSWVVLAVLALLLSAIAASLLAPALMR